MHTPSPGRIALVGSGEYLPVMHDVEAWLLQDRPAVYVQLATAAATEGSDVLAMWHARGAEAAERLGAEQVVIDVRTREDALDETWVERIRSAGLIYLSGGKPSYLAGTLVGTPVWQAIRDTWRRGASIAGCSAGAMALASWVPEIRHPHRPGVPGLGVLPGLRVIPHFDRFSHWAPSGALRWAVGSDETVLGIDEDTALVGEQRADGSWWFQSRGRQSAWVVTPRQKVRITDAIELEVVT